MDCTRSRYTLWSVAIAGLGALLIALGLDQLRRAARGKPEPPPLRRFT